MTVSYQMEIGSLVAQWRKCRGLTQMELAQKIGIHQSYLCHIEMGQIDIRMSTFQRLLESLGLTMTTFWLGPAPSLLGSL